MKFAFDSAYPKDRLLCWLGLHQWQHRWSTKCAGSSWSECAVCHRTSDLRTGLSLQDWP